MRYLCRLTLAAALLTAVASGAYAQNPNADSAPPPETTPVVEAAPAPPAPEAVPEPPVAQPENPPAVAPAPPDVAQPAPAPEQPAPAPDMSAVPAPAPPAKPVIKKKTTRIEKQKTEETQKTEPDPATAAAAAIAAAGTTGSNPPPPVDGGPPPAEAAASAAPPPPPAPIASVATENDVETKTHEQRGGSLWLVLGIILAAAVGIYLFMSRRRNAESLSIFDRDVSPTVERSITIRTSRPGPPITHHP